MPANRRRRNVIVAGDSECTGARSPGVVCAPPPCSRRINFLRYWPGHRPTGLGLFFHFRSTCRLATWAGVVLGSRRKATRLAHLWQAHRLIAEARGKAIRAKRTEQNPTN